MSSQNRIDRIRESEKLYHDNCYENHMLFQEGSWLHKPVKAVLDVFELLERRDDLRLLDLGCGVGRNSIPLARKLAGTKGKIVCVDLLESAIRNLEKYGCEHGVLDHLDLVAANVAEFPIAPNEYDFVFSISTLEHLDSKLVFERTIRRMIEGTRDRGVHCLLLNSNVKESVKETGEELDPMFELVFDTGELLQTLSTLYSGWNVLLRKVKPFAVEISRDGKPVILKSEVVTLAAQKR